MEVVKKSLSTYPKRTITLAQLEELLNPHIQSYQEFASAILGLESDGILEMVKSKGRTSRTPSLALHYRINKSLLAANHHQEIQRFRTLLHSSINLDDYYRKDPSQWQKDLPFIKNVNEYINKYSFPKESVPAPERSLELVGDEKWIVENGGKEVLERIGVFDKLKIIPVSEPLMFAINPTMITNAKQLHLIVENKTTYQGLLPALKDTEFSTLIYGSGKSIIKSIEQFSMQYPINAEHQFFYFGDIDREGVSIWYSLFQRQPTKLALPFYHACLEKLPVVGKEYQRQRAEAEELFLKSFHVEEKAKIKELLADGKYYPQEIIKTKELQQIWRGSDWKALI